MEGGFDRQEEREAGEANTWGCRQRQAAVRCEGAKVRGAGGSVVLFDARARRIASRRVAMGKGVPGGA